MRSIYARLHRRYGQKITGDERRCLVREKLDTVDLPQIVSEERRVAALGRLAAKRRPRVAIVGGGLAGLMAGYSLANRCIVTVFEARDRVGGRVWSKPQSSGIAEAGGELTGAITTHRYCTAIVTVFDFTTFADASRIEITTGSADPLTPVGT